MPEYRYDLIDLVNSVCDDDFDNSRELFDTIYGAFKLLTLQGYIYTFELHKHEMLDGSDVIVLDVWTTEDSHEQLPAIVYREKDQTTKD